MTKLKELCPSPWLWSSWGEQRTGSKLYKFELWTKLSSVSEAIINLLSSNDKWLSLKRNCRTFSASLIPHKWQTQISVSMPLCLCPMTALTLTEEQQLLPTSITINHICCVLSWCWLSAKCPRGNTGEGERERRACFLAKMPAGWEITIMIKAAAKVLVLSKSNA